MRVLVAYASKYGATAEIAEAVGKGLRDAGLTVDVTAVGDVGSIDGHDAVVLGSGLYMGRWLKDGARFLKRNEATLATKKVWIFSSGPTEEGDPEEAVEGWGFPKGLQPIADRIKPVEIKVFGGAADADKLRGFDRWVMKQVKAPMGDFRDWDAIAAWAGEIAATLKA